MAIDALDYYRRYNDDSLKDHDEDEDYLDNINGECYIGFSKLLQTELRLFDRRDSYMLSNKMSLRSSPSDFTSRVKLLSRSKTGIKRGRSEKKSFEE
jgi:hypothetical protein